jgi:hypothetical protein
MLFAFRGIRTLQVLLALAALASGVGAVFCLLGFTRGDVAALIIPAVILGLVFLLTFSATLRAPTSFVAIAEDRTRIRFAGFIDTVIANSDIQSARLVRHPWYGGLGVRSNLRGAVALVSAWGEVAELGLRRPVRVWLIPGLLPVHASRLRLSVLHPAKLVERFGGPAAVSPPARRPRKMNRRGP